MLRIIVRTQDCGMASNVGGDVETSHRSFDVSLPELQAHLTEHHNAGGTKYVSREVVGVEVLSAKATSSPTSEEG